MIWWEHFHPEWLPRVLMSWCIQWPRDAVATSAPLFPAQRMHHKVLSQLWVFSTQHYPDLERAQLRASPGCIEQQNGRMKTAKMLITEKKKITRSRWDKMDIFHLSWETLQYIICDASHTQPWPFTNKHDRGICHKIINRVGHKLDGAELLVLHTRLSLTHRVLGATVCASGCPPMGISAHPTGQDPRGSIHPDETQRFFTPKKPWVTLMQPRLTLGDHVYGAGFLSF